MLQEIDNQRLALPDFQRDFVWDPAATRDLLVSVMSRYPSGSLLTLRQSPTGNTFFAPRAFSGASQLNAASSPTLVLDGQQRLTSLYQAHRGVGDARYLLNLGGLIDNTEALHVENLDFDKLVSFEVIKPGRPVQSDDPQWQWETWTFPVHQYLKAPASFESWVEQAVAHHGGDASTQLKRRVRLAEIRGALLSPLGAYNFPVVELDETTSIVAVCKIFETLNLGGVRLSVFELITARVWAYGQNLRTLWESAQQDYPVFVDFRVDPYSILQAVTLRSNGSAQRSEVLNLRAENIEAHWATVVSGYAEALAFLRDQCGAQTEKWLPYSMVLVPMSACWDVIQALPTKKRGAALERVKQFFWCTIFTTNYDQGGNSQAQADYAKLRDWLPKGSGDAPEAVADFSFAESQIATARTNRRALYRGTIAALMQEGCLDFHSKQQTTATQMASSEIDSHHIFPLNWLKGHYDGSLSPELIVNRTLIDASTNKSIKDKAPSSYLQDMEVGTLGPQRDHILESHKINEAARQAMFVDDYAAFVEARTAAIVDVIETVTGKSVTRDLTGLAKTTAS
nr:DUF262 domain-containing protein [Kineococcus siccus]